MKLEVCSFETLKNAIEKNIHNSKELEKIKEAYLFAEKAHEGRMRLTNEPYITHPLNVAFILVNLNVDATTIIAALLHETINNGNATEGQIEMLFGSEVKNIITAISKINKLELSDDSESSALYLRKVLVGLAEDVRVLYIKLADRLHNMRTIWAVNNRKQKRKANETMTVLIPIAHRLGINSIKSELEDLCLKYLKPDIYNDILEKLNNTKEKLNEVLEEMKESISDILTDNGLKFEIKGRVKSVYSIYNKLNTGKKWNDIYDFLALRILVDKVSDCYLAIGLIHAKFRSIPKRFKDYIAMPKENMYQSLHTTVFGVDGNLFEIQLRTYEMDELAEKGIASHWSYKEKGTKKVQNVMEQKLEMFRNIIEANSEEENDLIFTNEVTNEFLSALIYVFTPKGDVVELPKGSTPIDFAYRIHSNVGDATVGAIVNDNIVPLNYELQDNDIVRIKTNSNAKPHKDWLNIVKTNQAKNKIKAYFSKQDRINYIEKGKLIFEKELRKRKLVFTEILSEEKINKISKDLKLKDLEEIYLSIGSFRYTAGYIINLITTEKNDLQEALIARIRNNPPTNKNYKSQVIVDGNNDISVSLAKCCNPIKGEEIIGVITKNQGIVIHQKDCLNLKNREEKFIETNWNINTENFYFKNLQVLLNDDINHMLEIFTVAAKKNVTIDSFKTEIVNEEVIYFLTLKIKNLEEFNIFKKEIEKLTYVRRVY